MTGYAQIWETLGIDPTSDRGAIKRAYLARLRVTNPEDDAAAFQQLRQAYEDALQAAEYLAEEEAEDATQAGDGGAPSRAASAVDPAAAPAARSEHSDRAPPPRPEPRRDDARQSVLGLLDDLARALDARDPVPDEKLVALLESLLTDDHLERIDLQELLEHRIAALLADTAPRSDALLEHANETFQWSQRRSDPALPTDAYRVLERISYQAYLQELMGEGEQADAWRRLTGPENPTQRWLNAYVFNHSRWAELDLLDRVEAEYPELEAQLNPANVAWWRRFESRPRITALSVGAWLLLSTFFGMFMAAQTAGPGEVVRVAPWVAGTFAVLVLVALVRLYLVEWPIIFSRRHWAGGLPMRLRAGWIVDCLVLMLLGLLAVGTPWAAWTLVGLSLLTLFWAAVAVGRPPPLYHLSKDIFMSAHSRLLRVILRNVMIGGWTIAVVVTIHEQLGWPLILCVASALACSGLGRELQQESFSEYFSPDQQRKAAWAVLALTLIVTWAVMTLGDQSEWHPSVLVWTVVCVILRRCFVPAISPFNSQSFIGFWLIYAGLMFVRAVLNVDYIALQRLWGETWYIQDGAFLFLITVMVSLIRFLWRRRGTPEES